MARVDQLSEQTKKEILKLYVDGNITVKEICQLYSIGCKALNDLLLQTNTPHRAEHRVGQKRTTAKGKKHCRHCGSRINPPDAVFCCQCGKPLLTDKERVIQMLEHLTNHFICLEQSKRDSYIAAVNAVIKLVKTLNISDD